MAGYFCPGLGWVSSHCSWTTPFQLLFSKGIFSKKQNILWSFAWWLAFLVPLYPDNIERLASVFVGLASTGFTSFVVSTDNSTARMPQCFTRSFVFLHRLEPQQTIFVPFWHKYPWCRPRPFSSPQQYTHFRAFPTSTARHRFYCCGVYIFDFFSLANLLWHVHLYSTSSLINRLSWLKLNQRQR